MRVERGDRGGCERLIVTSRQFRSLREGRGQLRKTDVMLRVLLRVLLPPAHELAGLVGEEETGSVRGLEVSVE